ncbi:hypothetical protein SEA_NOSILAM_25 [Gordonia phage NosilaM]|uniref:Uncharacterized protein n=1 Tax=Gordonia phage NosilaM TaxID=2507863 RepID=A0A410TE20_9CAUD|nr:hypothetical protein KNU46_gp25 [Gordonia phage NosilaM]QAU07268.1 hypothetical protein SEA_NOSILAM_25 [Gordonia phage NosilaM]
MSEHYRDTEEWDAVVNAVQRLQDWQGRRNGTEDRMVVDFVITTFNMPKERPTEDDQPIGGYGSFATQPFPHINIGLHDQGRDYWSDLVE